MWKADAAITDTTQSTQRRQVNKSQTRRAERDGETVRQQDSAAGCPPSLNSHGSVQHRYLENSYFAFRNFVDFFFSDNSNPQLVM